MIRNDTAENGQFLGPKIGVNSGTEPEVAYDITVLIQYVWPPSAVLPAVALEIDGWREAPPKAATIIG